MTSGNLDKDDACASTHVHFSDNKQQQQQKKNHASAMDYLTTSWCHLATKKSRRTHWGA